MNNNLRIENFKLWTLHNSNLISKDQNYVKYLLKTQVELPSYSQYTHLITRHKQPDQNHPLHSVNAPSPLNHRSYVQENTKTIVPPYTVLKHIKNLEKILDSLARSLDCPPFSQG